jgi:acetyl-CoA acyltransferase
MSDGAAAVILAGEKTVKKLNLNPIGRFVSYAVAGVEPDMMGIGPVYAIPKALSLANIKLKDIDIFELNEAFSAQSLACMKELELDSSRVNVNGGAVALGHPLGCTGSKLTVSLLYELKKRSARYAIVSMCVGGGMGACGIFERM